MQPKSKQIFKSQSVKAIFKRHNQSRNYKISQFSATFKKSQQKAGKFNNMSGQQKLIYYQMDNSKQNKQTHLQVKNRMIETKRNNNILPPQFHFYDVQKQTSFIINTHLIEDLPNNTSNQTSQETISDLEKNKVHGKEKQTGRMKLRDYLHLNNIEKRTKERRSASSSKSSSKQPRESTKNNKQFEDQSKMRQAQRIRNYENILLKEIEGKVVEEAHKLHQIQNYLKCQFQPKAKAKETFQYLYQIYNQLNRIEGINHKIGQTILQYEQPRQSSSKDEAENVPFWEKGVPKPSKHKEAIQQIIRQTNGHL